MELTNPFPWVAGTTRAQLVHGDALDPVHGLVTIPDQSVDHTIFDPPYEAEAHTRGRRIKVGRFDRPRGAKDTRGVVSDPITAYPPITSDERAGLARHVARVTRRWIVAFCQSEAIHLWREALQRGGARPIRVGVWDKPDGQPQLSGDRPGVGWEAIVIAHGPTERLRWNGGGRCAKWVSNTRDDVGTGLVTGKKLLTGQKPLDLMLQLVRDFTDPEDLILDPTTGAGTTGVAALQLGRRFIGWERVAEHHTLAAARINGANPRPNPKQQELFG